MTPMDWDNILIQAAISAEQGILESGKLGLVAEVDTKLAARQSIRLAKDLVEELKNELNSGK